MPVDDAATRAALDALIVKIGVAGAAAVRTAALAVQAEGMRRTIVKSGTNRRSWKTTLDPEVAGVYSARTGPSMVYSRRIELGFKGTDSAGRTYNQAPKPYVKPARDVLLPLIPGIMRDAIAAAIRG